MIAEAVESHGELYSISGTNLVTIEDSRQRASALPTVNVITAGTSGLADSDFTVTEIQSGNAPTGTGDINTDIPDHPGSGNPLPPISFDHFYNANDGSNT